MLARFVRLTHAFPSSFSAVNNTGLNVVCNQEYAQAVHHVSRICLLNELGLIGTVCMQQVHYHIIPAPKLNEPSVAKAIMPESTISMHQREFEARNELDDDDAQELVKEIRAHL